MFVLKSSSNHNKRIDSNLELELVRNHGRERERDFSQITQRLDRDDDGVPELAVTDRNGSRN